MTTVAVLSHKIPFSRLLGIAALVLGCRAELGVDAAHKKPSTDPLVLRVAEPELAVSEATTFYAEGGRPPYAYRLVSGSGSIEADSGKFIAGDIAGAVTVQVTDGAANRATLTRNVIPGLAVQRKAQGAERSLMPEVTGGTPPYRYEIIAGEGSIDSVTGRYEAPDHAATAEIRVTDAKGRRMTITITTATLRVALAQDRLVPGQTSAVTVEGGTPPFRLQLEPANLGSVHTEGLFAVTAGGAPGQGVLRVVDGAGASSEVPVEVAGALSLTIPGTDIAPGEALTVVSAGGFPPYSYSVDSGGATVDATTGELRALAAGPVSVKVTDAAGHGVVVAKTVIPSLAFTAGPATQLTNTSVTRAATGGTPPYLYRLLSGAGVINATGAFTSASFPGNAVLEVMDALGRSAVRTIRVAEPLAIDAASLTYTVQSRMSDQVPTTGGLAPLSFSIVSGPGAIDPVTGLFQAGTRVADTTIQVADAMGQTATVTAHPVRIDASGMVNALAQDSQYYYAVGNFTTSAPHQVRNAFAVDAATGKPEFAFSVGHPWTSMNNDKSRAVLVVGDDTYVGGHFSTYGGAPVPYLAKFDKYGRRDASFMSAGGPNALVMALATDGASLYVGGYFTTFAGKPAGKIAKIDLATGALDETFTQATGFGNATSYVYDIVVSGNHVYAGGNFSTYRGAAAQALAKLDKVNGNLDANFTRSTGIAGAGAAVWDLEARGNGLFVGGGFTSYRGGAVSNVVKLTLNDGQANDGDLDPLFPAAGANGIVFSLATTGTSLYMLGTFTQFNGTAAKGLAKVDLSSGAVDATFTDPAQGLGGVSGLYTGAFDLAVKDGGLVVGGNFTSYRGQSVPPLIRVDLLSGILDTTFTATTGVRPGDLIYGLGLQGQRLVVVGQIENYRGQPTPSGLARFSKGSGLRDDAFNALFPIGLSSGGTLSAIAVAGGYAYVGGNFSSFNGTTAASLVKIDLSTGAVDTAFTQATGIAGSVYAIVTDGTAVYVGGSFSSYRGTPVERLIKIDAVTGALDAGWATGANSAVGNGTVNALALNGSTLYAGGTFTRYRSSTANVEGLVKIKAGDGTLDPSWVTGANSGVVGGMDNVTSLLLDGGFLYVGGDFSRYRSATGNVGRIVKIDPADGSLDAAFAASTNDFTLNTVYALVMTPQGLACGGDFTTYRGQAAKGIAVVAPWDGSLVSFTAAPQFGGAVRALLHDGTDLVVGGGFTTVSNVPHQYLIRLDTVSGAVK